MTERDDPADDRSRRVKVTDKRRVHPKEGREAAPGRREAEAVPGEATVTSGDEAPVNESIAGTKPRGTGASEGVAEATTPGRAEEYLADLQRLKAEYDNYRKRILREQTRAVEFASEGLVLRLLEVIDEFELALVAAEHEQASDRFVHGVEMVYAKLVEILKNEGLERIDAQGKPFDPEIHEALLQAEGPEDGELYVADVLRRGYTLKGRVIRPAGVKVARR
jgi:molecular chaperone GrpE